MPCHAESASPLTTQQIEIGEIGKIKFCNNRGAENGSNVTHRFNPKGFILMRSTPTCVTESLRLAFRLKPICSVQSCEVTAICIQLRHVGIFEKTAKKLVDNTFSKKINLAQGDYRIGNILVGILTG